MLQRAKMRAVVQRATTTRRYVYSQGGSRGKGRDSLTNNGQRTITNSLGALGVFAVILSGVMNRQETQGRKDNIAIKIHNRGKDQ